MCVVQAELVLERSRLWVAWSQAQLSGPAAAERPIVPGRAVELALHLLSPRACGAVSPGAMWIA